MMNESSVAPLIISAIEEVNKDALTGPQGDDQDFCEIEVN